MEIDIKDLFGNPEKNLSFYQKNTMSGKMGQHVKKSPPLACFFRRVIIMSGVGHVVFTRDGAGGEKNVSDAFVLGEALVSSNLTRLEDNTMTTSKVVDGLLCGLNVFLCLILVLLNAGILLAECPKMIWCKSIVLSCTDSPNANGVCPGSNEYNYKDNFDGSDGDTYTCEESDTFANCVWTCPCIVILGTYGFSSICGPDNDSNACQLTKAVIKYAKEKGG